MAAYPNRTDNEIWNLISRKKTEHFIENSLAQQLGMKPRQVAHRFNRPSLMQLNTVQKLAAILEEELPVLIFHYGCGLGTITIQELMKALGLDPKTYKPNVPSLNIGKAKKKQPQKVEA